MGICYTSNLIFELNNKVYEHLFLPILESKECYHYESMVYILEEV